MSSGESAPRATSVSHEAALDATIVADPEPSQPLTIPAKVGRYMVESTIGSGAMGVVVRAHDPQLDRPVAIKLLHARGSTESESVTRMIREARALARLSHPNVIDVYDVGRVDERMFIAMEYVAGRTLDAWIAERRPSREAILEAFVQAGRGLAAAHDAGLVHRDFKPANVLRGHDGRVRVLDFGLASPPQHSEVEPTLGSLDGDPITNLRVTATGMVMGTPAYMSPEAHCGEPLDARSDQFSFCVTLFEALWGKRPFVGLTVKDVAKQAVQGEIHVPAHADVPSELREVVLRGLSPKPDDRFSSMDELLEQLKPRPRKRWPWVTAAVGAVAIAATGLALAPNALWRSSTTDCDAEPEARTTWSEARAPVQAAFEASGSPQAASTFARVDELVNTHVEALAAAQQEACEARADESITPAHLDRVTACLNRRQAELSGMISAFEQADAGAVRNAVKVVSDLRSLAECRDEALDAAIPPPPPQIAEAVERLHRDMAEARAQMRIGHYDSAATSSESIVTRAADLDYPPLLAEVQYLHGRALEASGEYERAREQIEAALMTAQEAGDEALVAKASTELIFLVGNRLRRPEQAQRWVRHAQAAVERLPEPGEAAIFLENTLANHYWILTKLPEAKAHFERAAAAYEALHGRQHPQTILTRSNLSMVLHDMGSNAEAKTMIEEVLADRIEAFGEDHPEVSTTYANLANIEQTLGNLEQASTYTQRAMEGIEAVLGREHPNYPQLLINLANTRYLQGRLDEAIELYLEAQTLLSKSLGPRAYLIGRTLGNLGAMKIEQDRHEEARTHLLQALDIYEEHLDAEDPQLASILGNLASADRDTGRLEKSLAGYDRALRLLETAHGVGHHRTGWVLHGRAITHQTLDDIESALADLRRAVAIFDESNIDPLQETKARFDLAEMLWEQGQHDEARTHMTEAQAAIELVREIDNDMPEKIAAWWAEHPPGS